MKKIKLKESDLTNIIERVIKQSSPKQKKKIIVSENELIESIPDIGGLFDRKTTDEVQALLDDFLSSESSSESHSSETTKYNKNNTNVDEAFDKFMNNE